MSKEADKEDVSGKEDGVSPLLEVLCLPKPALCSRTRKTYIAEG